MKTWSPNDIRHLQAFYADVHNKQLAEFFNTTVRSIECIAGRYNLHKSKLFYSLFHVGEIPLTKVISGFNYVLMPSHPLSNEDGYVLTSRLIMEKKLGRSLEKWEIIRYKNHDKSDDRPENLYLYTKNIDVETLLKLKDEGFSIKEICEKYNLSVAGYYRKLEKYKKEIGNE